MTGGRAAHAEQLTSARHGSCVLEVRGLSIAFTGKEHRDVVRNASLTLTPGRVTAIVGESGSGKTLLGRALLGLLPPGAEVTGGEVEFCGSVLPLDDERRLREVRGTGLGVVLQEPMSSLNPVVRIGSQLLQPLRARCGLTHEQARERVVKLLALAGIPDPAAALRRYPHEFSGGMRQRIAIVGALAMHPKVLVADEPTTALDKSTQADVMDMLLELCESTGAALLFVTHDLALVARYAHDVLVLRHGNVVDAGSVRDVLLHPRAAYVRELLAALDSGRIESSPVTAPVVMRLDDVDAHYRALPRRRLAQMRPALSGVSLELRRGEVVAVVGNSGSGKTTLGRVVAGLLSATRGAIERPPWTGASGGVQMVFQDPAASLDPRWTVSAIIAEGIPDLPADEREARVLEVLGQVQLDRALLSRRPHALSGGQRQRVAIARALAPRPDVIVADEPVSALDVPTQRQIVALLAHLARECGTSVMLVTHDFDVVEAIADRVAVIADGQLVELAPCEELVRAPRSAVSRRLLAASMRLEGDATRGYALAERKFESVDSEAIR